MLKSKLASFVSAAVLAGWPIFFILTVELVRKVNTMQE